MQAWHPCSALEKLFVQNFLAPYKLLQAILTLLCSEEDPADAAFGECAVLLTSSSYRQFSLLFGRVAPLLSTQSQPPLLQAQAQRRSLFVVVIIFGGSSNAAGVRMVAMGRTRCPTFSSSFPRIRTGSAFQVLYDDR